MTTQGDVLLQALADSHAIAANLRKQVTALQAEIDQLRAQLDNQPDQLPAQEG